jgi:hypothetical protein
MRAALRLVIASAIVLAAAPGQAQQERPSALALDTVAAVDEIVDSNGNSATGITLDAVASLGLGRHFEVIVRPFAQGSIRRVNDLTTVEWNRQIWIATLRYQRPGPVGVRVDAGLIPSPVGLANLMLRPHLNPTLSLPSALFTSLPPLEPGAPRLNLLGAVYGTGATVTVSGLHWDLRAAAIDTSPVRTRRVFARPGQNAPRFPTVVVGGGVTPLIGVRVGASVTRTGWQRARENLFAPVDRDVTMVAIESDVSFRYTRLAAEWVRNRFETVAGTRTALGWWVQGQQTLTPRLYAAGRVERIGAPLFTSPGSIDLSLVSFEEVLGVRLTPELTLRVSHRARRGFGVPDYDNQVGVSMVWWRRWK